MILYMYLVSLVAHIVLGAIFLTSSVAKIGSSLAFEQAVQKLSIDLLAPKFVKMVAQLLPPLEVILALALVVGIWPKMVAVLVLGLLMVFTVLMVISLIQGKRFPCNCFGHRSSDIGIGSVSRNVVLIVMSILLIIVSPWTTDKLGWVFIEITGLSGSDMIALITIGISLYLLILIVSEIDTLVRALKLDNLA